MAYLEYRSDWINRLVDSRKTLVIQAGNFVKTGLQKERTREEEILCELRLQQEDQLEEIQEAYFEPKGVLSLLKVEKAKEVQKKDLPALRDLLL